MSKIGRQRLTVFDLIDLQVKKGTKSIDLEKLKRQVTALEGKLTDSLITLGDSFSASSANETCYGYDYTAMPPIAKMYPNINARFDNLDMGMIGLPVYLGDFIDQLEAIQDQLAGLEGFDVLQEDIDALEIIVEDLQNATLTIVQYIPDEYIDHITMPDRIEVCRVYRNGLRLFEGGDYDYIFTDDTISVEGNAGDRFIVEYNPIPWS